MVTHRRRCGKPGCRCVGGEQQLADLGDFTGLVRDVPLGDHRPRAVDHRRQQVDRPPVGLPRAAFPSTLSAPGKFLLCLLLLFRLLPASLLVVVVIRQAALRAGAAARVRVSGGQRAAAGSQRGQQFLRCLGGPLADRQHPTELPESADLGGPATLTGVPRCFGRQTRSHYQILIIPGIPPATSQSSVKPRPTTLRIAVIPRRS